MDNRWRKGGGEGERKGKRPFWPDRGERDPTESTRMTVSWAMPPDNVQQGPSISSVKAEFEKCQLDQCPQIFCSMHSPSPPHLLPLGEVDISNRAGEVIFLPYQRVMAAMTKCHWRTWTMEIDSCGDRHPKITGSTGLVPWGTIYSMPFSLLSRWPSSPRVFARSFCFCVNISS